MCENKPKIPRKTHERGRFSLSLNNFFRPIIVSRNDVLLEVRNKQEKYTMDSG